jgi:cysteinyl-tRNA synthetase
MSLDLLGEGFDLHTGGLDLAFPHHENERAQAVASGRVFSRRWAHHGMIVDETGEKMSKSVGNGLSLPELLDAYDARAFRLLLLQSHYRKPVSLSDASLVAASAGVERLDSFAREFAAARHATPDPVALERFRERMDDDLDTPNAVADAFDLIKRARSTPDEQASGAAAAVFEIFEQALGLPLHDQTDAVPEAARDKARQRDEARAAKDWARADQLRSELQAEGWTVEDGPDGTVIR